MELVTDACDLAGNRPKKQHYNYVLTAEKGQDKYCSNSIVNVANTVTMKGTN